MRMLPAVLLAALALMGCRRDGGLEQAADRALFPLQLPAGFPAPPVPDDNPLTVASVRLGKALFHEARLSRDGTISCASCHRAGLAFTDGRPLSVGIEERVGLRNAPSLGNVAYHPAFFRDGGVPTLEQQAIAPILEPTEMDHDINAAAAALAELEPYRSMSQAAYGKPLDAWVITRALASYQRTLLSGWSRWDRWRAGDATALTAAETRGWELFNSTALGCSACHTGFDLSDHQFHNVGQYLEYADAGRARITLREEDTGKFKTPSLRNVARTAPYMHDGSMATLEEVVDHFASGGAPHSARSPLMRNFVLSEGERADLLAFLRALNDERSMDQVP